jgi:putative CRISPR-associated protein (TIGR02620 family)
MNYLIISRHESVPAWLRTKGITGEVVAHATTSLVRGRNVVGVLPLSLAAEAASVTSIDLPGLTPELRGKELTVAEMDSCGAVLVRYTVTKV